MRRVLFLSYNFPPMGGGGVQRTVKFIKYLPNFGWEAVVIAAEDKTYWARDETLLDDIHKSTIIKRYRPLSPRFFYSVLEKLISREFSKKVMENVFIPDSRIIWAISAFFYGLWAIKKHGIKLIYSTSPPHSVHLAALLLKKITGLQWVSDFRDPWTINYHHNPRNSLVKWFHVQMESKVFKNADRVICITEEVRGKYCDDLDIDPERLVTIYNGYDPDDFVGIEVSENNSKKVVIAHSGSLYSNIYPKIFFLALARCLRDNPSLRERLVVKFLGIMDSEIIAEIKDSLEDNAVFLGYLNHQNATVEIVSSDCNLITIPFNNKLSYNVPGKLFEYMATGRPILAVVPPGEVANLVKLTKTGIVICENDPEKLSDKIREAVFEIEKMKREGTFSPDVEVIKQFERRNETKKLCGLFDELIDGGPGR